MTISGPRLPTQRAIDLGGNSVAKMIDEMNEREAREIYDASGPHTPEEDSAEQDRRKAADAEIARVYEAAEIGIREHSSNEPDMTVLDVPASDPAK